MTAAEFNRKSLGNFEIVSESPEAAKKRNAKEKELGKRRDEKFIDSCESQEWLRCGLSFRGKK